MVTLLIYFIIKGGAIFQANRVQSDINKDPFRPITPNNNRTNSFGAPPKPTAKPRKPSRILREIQQNSQETSSYASEKRNTKRIRRNIRISKVFIIYFYYSCLLVLTNLH